MVVDKKREYLLGLEQAFALLNFYCNKSAILAINAIIAIIQ